MYTTDCPKCNILKKKLEASGVPFRENHDLLEMERLGMTEAPSLMVDGELLGFSEAVRWVSGQTGKKE